MADKGTAHNEGTAHDEGPLVETSTSRSYDQGGVARVIHPLPPRNNTNYPLAVSKLLAGVEPGEGDVLQYHQKVVKYYFESNPDSRGLLVFHATGTGKTMLAVSIADAMKGERRIIILAAKSLQHNFKKEVEHYMRLLGKGPEEIDIALERGYKFISSNAGNMSDQLARMDKTGEEVEFERSLDVFNEDIKLEGALLIYDESQNLFNGIISGSRNASKLYAAIMAAKDLKLVFLSATPIINDVFAMVPCYNMLAGHNVLPTEYDDFYNFYIDGVGLAMKNREKFKNRIFGLTSYMGDWWRSGGVSQKGQTIVRDKFPDQLPTIVEFVPMSTQQFAAYAAARELESGVKGKKVVVKVDMQKPRSDPGSTYRVASRQISNFLLPEAAKVKRVGAYGYDKVVDMVVADQLERLEIYSPKMAKIIDNMEKEAGLCVVYSSFVTGEGLKIFSMVLKTKGWSEYEVGVKKKGVKKGKVFAFITGGVSAEERADVLRVFNGRANRDGQYIDLVLLSGAGAEGLDFKNVRSIHIMEPYWNYGRIEQIIARAVRYRSHDDFDKIEDKTVQPYIYLSDYPTQYVFKPTATKKIPEKTTDVHLYTKSVKAKVLIDHVYAAMIESSVDCSVHVKRAPLEVQKKINCLMCTPSNSKLYHPDVATDIRLENPCKRQEVGQVRAHEVIYRGQSFYYTRAENGDLSIYEFKEGLEAYVELDRTHPYYEELVAMLES